MEWSFPQIDNKRPFYTDFYYFFYFQAWMAEKTDKCEWNFNLLSASVFACFANERISGIWNIPTLLDGLF